MACILESLDPKHLQHQPAFPETPFYVLTNQNGINGAACILYKDVIKNFAEGMDRDILILPSSIHEVLLLPDDDPLSYDELGHLVTHINQTEVVAETVFPIRSISIPVKKTGSPLFLLVLLLSADSYCTQAPEPSTYRPSGVQVFCIHNTIGTHIVPSAAYCLPAGSHLTTAIQIIPLAA